MRDVSAAVLDREVEGSGYAERGVFTILANAKAFKLLINGLYADKPRAIIREIWSNAFDSHKAVGTPDRPFHCHLPTRFDPTFSVRDFGVSLTHQQVMKLYTTVFQSTKEDTNDQVGKFGLGSKTPFAYTDAYTVTAWLEGEKRTYNAFMDAKGIPTIALFATELTEDENGLEVSFPVQMRDVDDFIRAAKQTIWGFVDIHPVITGAQLVLPAREVLSAGTGWTLYKNSYGGHGTCVRQGCVLYPLDTGALQSHLSYDLRRILKGQLIIDMPIGTVDITPSRESLSYEPKTVENIVVAIRKIAAEIAIPYQARMDVAKTKWQARGVKEKIFSELSNQANYDLQEVITGALRWRGKPIETSDYLNDIGKKFGVAHQKVGHSSYRRRNSSKFYWSEKEAESDRISVGGGAACFIIQQRDEVITRTGRRLEKCLEDRSLSHATWVRYDSVFQVAKFLVAIGRPPIVLHLRDLPVPPPLARGPRGPVKMRALPILEGGGEDEKIDPDLGGYYVRLKRNDILNSDHKDSQMTRKSLARLFERMKSAGLVEKDARLFGIPKNRKGEWSTDTNPDWIEFFGFATSSISVKTEAAVFNSKNQLSQVINHIPSFMSAFLDKCLENGVEFEQDSSAALLLDLFRMARKEIAADDTQAVYYELGEELGLFSRSYLDDDERKKHPLGEALHGFYQAYPLVRLTERSMSARDTAHHLALRDYVRMVDAGKWMRHNDVY